ncbi:NADPH-dependent FMN reductase [Propionimicrobium sp. PCR01-08-3]|uniref:NADPH-dependent FMN reductase n=1 Tax=Propionimicrobium sp. PCR01-08-3 TaxID=3052086 RepID=UPI00255C361F|nr:NADPH-dependent FMN reductase [Propionimicrobium sp. PCR01-08-3]WIY82054.1 NADPH-dependent FMN reductase [Propionimicrobium sp. PCR01-08-3]
MKLAAIVGTNAELSFNRLLLLWMQKHFAGLATIEVLEIGGLPAFNEDLETGEQPEVLAFAQQIEDADGVIISCPEYDHSIPAVLKSALEWMSYQLESLKGKPVLIVGGSYGPLGSARAQLHLRQILASPEIQANVLPGKEVLLGNVQQIIDSDGELTDASAVEVMNDCFSDFLRYVQGVQRAQSERE